MNEIYTKQLKIWRDFIYSFFHKNFLVAYNEKVFEIGVVRAGKYKELLDNKAPHRDTLDKCVEGVTFNIDVDNIEDYIGPETYDVVICSETLEHLTKPWIIAEKITKILKKGGLLYITVPSFLFWHPGLPYYGDNYRFLPRKSLTYLFEGLMEIEYMSCHPKEYKGYPLGICSIMRKDN